MNRKHIRFWLFVFIFSYLFRENITYAINSTVEETGENVGNNINIVSKIFNGEVFVNIIFAIFIVVLTFFLSKIFPSMLSRHFEKQIGTDGGNKEEILGVLVRTSSVAILAIGTSAVLTILGIDMTIFIGGLGFGLGYTIKSFLENFITGIIMVTQGTYHNGDLIEIEGKMGKIKEISSLYTSIEQFDGVIYFIPNVKFIQEKVSNYYVNSKRRIEINVVVDYTNDIYKAKTLIMQVVKKFPNILITPTPKVLVNDLGSDGVLLNLRVWIDSNGKYFSTKSNLTETINLVFKENGIVIPYRNITITNLDSLKKDGKSPSQQ